MVLPFGIQQSTLAGGLTSVLAFGLGLGLTALGVPGGAQLALGLATLIVPVVVHFVPDAAQVDADIKEIAAVLPQAYAAPGDFPNVPPSPTPSNINKG